MVLTIFFMLFQGFLVWKMIKTSITNLNCAMMFWNLHRHKSWKILEKTIVFVLEKKEANLFFTFKLRYSQRENTPCFISKNINFNFRIESLKLVNILQVHWKLNSFEIERLCLLLQNFCDSLWVSDGHMRYIVSPRIVGSRKNSGMPSQCLICPEVAISAWIHLWEGKSASNQPCESSNASPDRCRQEPGASVALWGKTDVVSTGTFPEHFCPAVSC